jgi:hypothetical protein
MDLTSQASRRAYLEEITGQENNARREEHFKRMEVYNERQAQWVIEKLLSEFSQKTVSEMRKILSINLTRRIVDELASIYRRAPERSWTELSEEQHEQVEAAYEDFGVNKSMKRANKLFKLHRQLAIQVVPKFGKLYARVLSPHQFDVIPDPEMPEKPLAYIISTIDRSDFLTDDGAPSEQQVIGDRTNQKIADPDDYLSNVTFVWWTAEFNFTTDASGAIIGEVIPNPIGKLPFIDIAEERDFEYWVRAGSDIVDFATDFLKILSDHFNIIRLQGYSQAVIVSEKAPDSFVVGPNHVLHLKQDRDSPKDPSFQFVTPSPDVGAGITSIEMLVSLFLSSRGIDAGSIQTKGSGQTFASGIERLLSMLQKFEASSDDIDQFRMAEKRYFELFKAWQDASKNNDLLAPEWKMTLPEASEVSVSFHEPEMIQTQTEREDSQIKLLEAGLTSRKYAIMEIHGVTETVAEEMMKEIEEENGVNKANPEPIGRAPEGEPEVDPGSDS